MKIITSETPRTLESLREGETFQNSLNGPIYLRTTKEGYTSKGGMNVRTIWCVNLENGIA